MHDLLRRRGAPLQVCPTFWKGKRVAITGAAGTIGSALAVRLAAIGCAELGLLDSFDHGLITTADAIRRIAPQQAVDETLGDIRDVRRTTAWMQAFKPDIVVHAAALKHVHLGERHPAPCVMTNLIGADNAMAASHAAGAGRFILISSDKAADPVCIMGATKRLAELRLRGFQREHDSQMLMRAVRFGNVFGSQGSVIPRFLEQIEAGGPLELTHPDMERFFMSIDEAVDFILAVAALDPAEREQGQTYFMDMGEPHSIKQLGEELIRRSGRQIEIKTTGVRPGERLHEILVDQHENIAASALSGVYRIAPRAEEALVTAADLAALQARVQAMEDALLRDGVFHLLRERITGAKAGVARKSRASEGILSKAGAAFAVVAVGVLAVTISEMLPALKAIRYPGLTSLCIVLVALGSIYLVATSPGVRGKSSGLFNDIGLWAARGPSLVRERAGELVTGAAMFVGGLLTLDWLNII